MTKLEISQKYRALVIQKIASYFRISRADMKELVELNDDILTLKSVGEFTFDESIYVTHLNTLKLEQLLYCKKFEASPIFEEFLNGEALAGEYAYVMALHLNGLIMMIYRSDAYDGCGGIQLNGDSGGYAIVPILNFLADRYPKNEE